MSSFICDKCGKRVIDTVNGYVTECEHYPYDKFGRSPKKKDTKIIWDGEKEIIND